MIHSILSNIRFLHSVFSTKYVTITTKYNAETKDQTKTNQNENTENTTSVNENNENNENKMSPDINTEPCKPTQIQTSRVNFVNESTKDNSPNQIKIPDSQLVSLKDIQTYVREQVPNGDEGERFMARRNRETLYALDDYLEPGTYLHLCAGVVIDISQSPDCNIEQNMLPPWIKWSLTCLKIV
jgi:hypothetical protein